MSEVAPTPVKNRRLAEGIGRLRFVFENGPLGFNVYREIAVFSKQETGN